MTSYRHKTSLFTINGEMWQMPLIIKRKIQGATDLCGLKKRWNKWTEWMWSQLSPWAVVGGLSGVWAGGVNLVPQTEFIFTYRNKNEFKKMSLHCYQHLQLKSCKIVQNNKQLKSNNQEASALQCMRFHEHPVIFHIFLTTFTKIFCTSKSMKNNGK